MVLKNFQAEVYHGRILPRNNSFSYIVNYCYGTVNDYKYFRSLFYSYDKPNIFSVCKLDSHEEFIKSVALKYGFNEDLDQIYYLCILKMWGYVFNPVSFWFLYKKKQLRVVVAEVRNTFNEKHFYVINNQNFAEINSCQWLEINKKFHVSPFLERKGTYKFQFNIKKESITIKINYFNKKDLVLKTSMNGSLSYVNLYKQTFCNPLNTFKVILLIHWQALKLYLKKNKIISKPQQYDDKISN